MRRHLRSSLAVLLAGGLAVGCARGHADETTASTSSSLAPGSSLVARLGDALPSDPDLRSCAAVRLEERTGGAANNGVPGAAPPDDVVAEITATCAQATSLAAAFAQVERDAIGDRLSTEQLDCLRHGFAALPAADADALMRDGVTKPNRIAESIEHTCGIAADDVPASTQS